MREKKVVQIIVIIAVILLITGGVLSFVPSFSSGNKEKNNSNNIDGNNSDNGYENKGSNINLSYKDNSGANQPELTSGMIPVIYDEIEKTWKKADGTTKWYDYDNQMWANAVTVTKDTRSTYMNAANGTKIEMKDINTMWVWIPRYEYKYTNLGNQYAGGTAELPGEIEIKFISKKTVNPSDANTYKIPIGFDFSNDGVSNPISGFWIGKYETTGKSGLCASEDCTSEDFYVTVLPKQRSIDMVGSLSSMFYISRSMQNSSNASLYGFDKNMDVHMLKNSEWGIVAMLSQSKYGKRGNSAYEGANKEVYAHNKMFTGYSCGGPAKYGCSGTITYDTPDTGYGASTTGTIYGVYDMSGGDAEYVMGNYKKNTGSYYSEKYNNFVSGSNFIGNLYNGNEHVGPPWPEAKYYDLYEKKTTDSSDLSNLKAGDATYETAGWYGDYNGFVNIRSAWFVRGGSGSYTEGTGIFSSSSDYGNAKRDTYTFRIAIVK